MIIWRESVPGTIREENQDLLHLNEDLGILILADGYGPQGAELARQGAIALERTLLRGIGHTLPHRAAGVLTAAFADAQAHIREQRSSAPHRSSSGSHFGVVWVVEGHVLLAATGPVGILGAFGDEAVHQLHPRHLPTLAALQNGQVTSLPAPEAPVVEPEILGPFPAPAGSWVLMMSEGLLMSQSMEDVMEIAPALPREPEMGPKALFLRASQRYDGDDRTLLFAQLVPRDLISRIPEDIVASVDFDRRFSVPMWVPLLLSLVAFVGTLVVHLVSWTRGGRHE